MSRNNKFLFAGLGLFVLLLGINWYWTNLQSAATENTVVQQPQVATHNLTLKNRELTPEIVTVTQGDQVTVKVMSDENGEFHISGYEIENDMTAGIELSFSFIANQAGRYNFELHPKAEVEEEEDHNATTTEEHEGAEEEDIVIGAFVVNPK